jgi:hypothetical protein
MMVGMNREPEAEPGTLEAAYFAELEAELQAIVADGDPGPQGPDPALEP